jgi:hypothetical protein
VVGQPPISLPAETSWIEPAEKISIEPEKCGNQPKWGMKPWKVTNQK